MIGFIVAGLIIGLLARLLLPGRQRIGLLWTLILGVLGSVAGGVVANAVGSGDIMELNVFGFIVAVLAAVGLLAVAERSGLGAGSDRRRLGHR
ncbi:MAG TPA: GlsB/YeaQ/YmgE family stress response membrane protein [Solirubrobacteraceae bacterium]|nr:GlsB/YeaQ/YmgE family stress response membrane protein [Solirubrobacteraceae bacterium]